MAEVVIAPRQRAKLKEIGKLASSRFETVCNSYKLAAHANREKLPGAFVECGVAHGSQVAAMAYASMVTGSRREYWLFDSYCGIPLAGPKDDCQPGIGRIKHDVSLTERQRLRTSGAGQSRTLPRVMANFRMWGIPTDTMHFVKGWFQDTLPKTDTGAIAILRLDGDLYESTIVAFRYLYKHVVPGGFVIIDDYALKGCRTAVHEFMGQSFAYNVVPTTNKVIWWRKK